MKKNAFTLIELLGAIVIIAIIAIIAIPTISNVINKARLSSLKNSAYGILDAAVLYNAQYSNGKTIRFDIEDNNITSKDTSKLISYKGNIKNGSIIIDKRGKVTICITDGVNAAYKNYTEKDITLVDKSICSIPENKSVVYLDGEATRSELSNQELTDLVASMQDEITSLKSQLNAKASKEELDIVSSVASNAEEKANSSVDSTQFDALSTTVLNNQTSITNIQNNFDNYYNKTTLDSKFNNYYDKTKVDAISTVANNAQTIASNAATKTDLNSLSSTVSGHTTSINSLTNNLATKQAKMVQVLDVSGVNDSNNHLSQIDSLWRSSSNGFGVATWKNSYTFSYWNFRTGDPSTAYGSYYEVTYDGHIYFCGFHHGVMIKCFHLYPN